MTEEQKKKVDEIINLVDALSFVCKDRYIKQKKQCEEIINLAEGKYKKDLDEIFDNFHEGYVPFALLFHYGDTDTFFYYYNPISMLFGYFIPLSFTLSQMGDAKTNFLSF